MGPRAAHRHAASVRQTCVHSREGRRWCKAIERSGALDSDYVDGTAENERLETWHWAAMDGFGGVARAVGSGMASRQGG